MSLKTPKAGQRNSISTVHSHHACGALALVALHNVLGKMSRIICFPKWHTNVFHLFVWLHLNFFHRCFSLVGEEMKKTREILERKFENHLRKRPIVLALQRQCVWKLTQLLHFWLEIFFRARKLNKDLQCVVGILTQYYVFHFLLLSFLPPPAQHRHRHHHHHFTVSEGSHGRWGARWRQRWCHFGHWRDWNWAYKKLEKRVEINTLITGNFNRFFPNMLFFKWHSFIFPMLFCSKSARKFNSCVTDQLTNQPMEQPTDRRTLLEMQECI